MIVLSLCDLSGNMVRPWVEAGYEAWIVDIQHPTGITRDGRLVRVGCDILHWLPPKADYRIVFAFPPCTNLAASGARWFRDKGLAGLAEAVALVERGRDICEWSRAPWMLENPISTLSTYWRKPGYLFDPFEYGGYEGGENDGYSKRTCLWAGGGFVMPERRPIPVDRPDYIHRLSPSADRANIRSQTPLGFARAVFEANEGQVCESA